MLPLVLFLAADLTATEIMQRLGWNQTQAAELRKQIVYEQSVLSRMHRGNNKLARECAYEFIVTPKERSTEKKRTSFKGKFEKDGQIFEYDDPEFEYKSVDIDGQILDELTGDFTNDGDSRDGISKDFFPLTPIKQLHYNFTLAGRENYQGRDVYKITYTPKKKKFDDGMWFDGEVLVDANEFQPVLVTSHQTKGIPMAVKIIFGIDIKQVGFKTTYAKVEDGLWFPTTYGGEFDVRVLFGYRRKISISLKNSGIRRVNVDSSVRFEEPTPQP